MNELSGKLAIDLFAPDESSRPTAIARATSAYARMTGQLVHHRLYVIRNIDARNQRIGELEQARRKILNLPALRRADGAAHSGDADRRRAPRRPGPGPAAGRPVSEGRRAGAARAPPV